jgi:DNA-binding MarR family transcriptional regulator
MASAPTIGVGTRTRRASSAATASKAPAARRPKPGPADAAAVLQQFRQLFRVSQRHFQRIETRCGVSGAQLWALAELSRQPGLTISELAQALSVHLSTSSNLLDKLEAQGLVRRERRSRDQRIVRVYITAGGRKLLSKAPKPVEGVIPGALGRMDPAALRRLHTDLATLLELASARSARDALKHLGEP